HPFPRRVGGPAARTLRAVGGSRARPGLERLHRLHRSPRPSGAHPAAVRRVVRGAAIVVVEPAAVRRPHRPPPEPSRVPGGTAAVYGGQTALIDPSPAVSAPTLGIDPSTYQQGGWWRRDYAVQPLPALLAKLSVPRGGVPIASGSKPLVTMDAPADIAGYQLD